jgi:PAS domain S-box-containing protein
MPAAMKSELVLPKIPDKLKDEPAMLPILHQFDAMQARWQLAPAVFVEAKTWRIVIATPSAEQLFGYELGGLSFKHINDLVPERLRDKHMRHLQNFLEEPFHSARPMGQGLALSGRRLDGQEFPCTVALYRFVHAGEKFVLAEIVDMRAGGAHPPEGSSSFPTKAEVTQIVRNELKDSGLKTLGDPNLFGK